MKNKNNLGTLTMIIVAIAMVVAMTSCQKEDSVIPKVEATDVKMSQVVNPVTANTIFKLDFKAVVNGTTQNFIGLTPLNVYRWEDYDTITNQNVIIGNYIEFQNSTNTFKFGAFRKFDGTITQVMGYIDVGNNSIHTFVLIINTSTINICGNAQNVPVIYRVYKQNS